MELFRNSDTKRAGTVFVMAACIVLFFLLITPEESAQLAAPLFKNGNFYSILGMAMLIILYRNRWSSWLEFESDSYYAGR